MDLSTFSLVILTSFGAGIIGAIGIAIKPIDKNGNLTNTGRVLIGLTLFLGIISTILQVKEKIASNEQYETELKIATDNLQNTTKTLVVTDSLKNKLDSQKDTISSLQKRLVSNQEKLQKANRLVIEYQQNLLEFSENTINTLTGGNSFCYFFPSIMPNFSKANRFKIDNYEINLGLLIQGDYPLKDIKYVICDAVNRIKYEDRVNCLSGQKKYLLGNKSRPANFSTYSETITVSPDSTDLIFDIYFEASGREFEQRIRIIKVNEYEWAYGFRVIGQKFESNSKGGWSMSYTRLKEEIFGEFPLTIEGEKPDLGDSRLGDIWKEKHFRRK